jgi:hypothetical protein
MHPCAFVFILLLKDGVSNNQIIFSAECEKLGTIAITIPNSMRTENWPGIVIGSNTGVEVTKNDQFVINRNFGNDGVKI